MEVKVDPENLAMLDIDHHRGQGAFGEPFYVRC